MFLKKEEYQKVSDEFFNLHHGIMVKLTAPNRKNEIYGFILRCEANENDKKLLVFSFISPIYYSKMIPSFSKETGSFNLKPFFKNIKEVKLYGMKRIMEKWKNIKEEKYLNYDEINDQDIIDNVISDLNALKKLYSLVKKEISDFNEEKIKETSKYILKEFRTIKKYYKETDDIRVIFL